MAAHTPQETALHDDLLDRFVGRWHIRREFGNRTAENVADVSWELEHHYLRIAMVDVETPVMYAAHVYICFERPDQRYVIHWLDTTSGSMPQQLGYGHKDGNVLAFEWKDDDGTLRNVFTWRPETETWTSEIDQTGQDGEWMHFCTDTYSRIP